MTRISNRLLTLVLSVAMVITAIAWLGTDKVSAEDGRQVFVGADYIKAHASDANTVIAEVSWGPDAPDKLIKGAIHVNTDDLESNGPDDGYELWDLRDSQNGYKKLMDTLAASYGITKDTNLICYGANGSDSAATRLAMAALMLGVNDVKVLDGGFEAWNGDTDAAAKPVAAVSFGLDKPAHPEYVLSTDEMLDGLKKGLTLVSIRSYDEFIGQNSGYAYIDKAGEPLGAIWGHDTDDGSYLDNGKVISYDKMVSYIKDYKADFDGSKDNEVAFYCGTGWRATIPFLIAYQEGKNNMKLWDDGWYVYSGAYADAWNWPGNEDPAAKKPVKDYPVQIGDPKKGNVVETTTSKLEPIYNPLRGLSAKSEKETLTPGTYDSNFEIMPDKKPGITNNVKFTSSDEKVATVDAEGKVTVVAGAEVGKTATITATGNATIGSTPDKEGTHKTASYEVVVGKYLANGQTATVGGSKYKVLSANSKTAAFVKAANKKSVAVPATVKINGQTLKVTQVNAKAFTSKKIRTVTIGKNVKLIKANAFKSSKATKVVLKTKALKKAKVKGSLKGSKVKTVQVKLGSKAANKKYVKTYKKIFTKANAGKKVTVK